MSQEYKEYVYLNSDEKKLSLKLSIIFTILYLPLIMYFSSLNWIIILLATFIYLYILIPTHLLFHKFCAYKQAFSMQFQEIKFDRFHLETHATLTKRSSVAKPIPYWLLSALITLLSVGFIVITNVFTYTHQKIDHLFFGKRKAFEYSQGNLYPQENTQLRQSYAFFFSNLYPLILILILGSLKSNPLFEALLIITINYTFFNLFPILPNTAFQYFIYHTYLWGASFMLFILFSLSAVFISSPTSLILISLTGGFFLLLVQFTRFIGAS
ncbi:MAG: hypothetical protein ACLFPL_00555 [Candidatus Nanoarchaeia archaeon]